MTHKYKVTLRKTIEYVALIRADDEDDAYERATDAIEGGQSWEHYEEQWHEYSCSNVDREEDYFDPDAARDDRNCLLYQELHG